MIRAIFVSLLIVVCSFVGGMFMLTAGAITIEVLDDSKPASAASAPLSAGTESEVREPSVAEPTPTSEAAPEDTAAEELAADEAVAHREAEEARRVERAQARAEDGKRIAAAKAAERAVAEKAEKEAAEKAAAEKEAAAEAAAKAEAAEMKAAAEKAAKEKAAIAKAAEEKAAAEKRAAGEWVTVVAIVDGDTVDVSTGARIRIAGIDTPERGECGYEEAGARMMELARDREGVLVKAGADSIDRYGRLIRYLDVDGGDVGLTLIEEGLAIARYDSRDGYGWHDREAEYVAADAASPQAYACAAPQPIAQPLPQPPAGGSVDPQFGSCREAIANGYGPYIVGVDPEYHWYRDGDSDGIVCER